MLNELLDWDLTTSNDFKNKFYRAPKVITQGSWGVRSRVFFDVFYGESLLIRPGHQYTRPKEKTAFSVLVWRGQGIVNENEVNASVESKREFVCVSDTPLRINCEAAARDTPAASEGLLIYLFFPLQEKRPGGARDSRNNRPNGHVKNRSEVTSSYTFKQPRTRPKVRTRRSRM